MATSRKLVAANKIEVARDLRNILAANEAELERIAFVNPDDPRVATVQEEVTRQQTEYGAFIADFTDEELAVLASMPQYGPAPHTPPA